MRKSITIYVKSEWKIKPFASTFTTGHLPQHKIERFIWREDATMLKVATEVAAELGLKLEVWDLATPRGWFNALINNVKKMPTIIFSDHRLQGVVSKAELVDRLKVTVNQLAT
ncbi:MAG: hypothetical protein QHH24_05970 [Candidatus Bathyarchaeota archaeon]|jgi:hypothetical protein|nr:hypothetical protein [Candidatus Bathyarchaeota archaeon]